MGPKNIDKKLFDKKYFLHLSTGFQQINTSIFQ